MKFLDYEGVKYLWSKILAKFNVISAYTVNGKAISANPTITKSDIGLGNVSNVAAVAASEKGVASGVATLGSDGKVPAAQLPSYVDDVLEYNGKASFPTTGETGKIYVDTATNLTYRWSGTAYVEISPSLALGETSSTAFAGDKGAAAYKHAVTNKGAAFASGLYKITTNGEGHVTAATAVAKSDITALGVPSADTNTSHTHSAGTGLTVSGAGGTSGATTYAAKLKDTTANTADSAKSTSTDGGLYAVEVDKSGCLAVRVPWVNTQGEDTTYTAGVGLTLSGTTFKAKLNSETSLGTIGTTGKLYAVGVDANGKLAVSVPWTDNNTTYTAGTGLSLSGTTFSLALTKALVTTALGYTPPTADTHYASSTIAGASATATANAAASNGSVYLNHIENGAVKSSHNIVGGGATTVVCDANGKITISSANTTYNVATASANGLMSASDKSKLDNITASATADSALTTDDIDAAIAEAEAA